MVVMEYVFIPSGPYKRPLPDWTEDVFRRLATAFPSVPRAYWPWGWWAAGCLVVMVFLPMLLLRVFAGVKPSETGLKLKGTARHAPLYALMFVVFAPVVWWVSRRADFQWTYPFYPPKSRAALGVA